MSHCGGKVVSKEYHDQLVAKLMDDYEKLMSGTLRELEMACIRYHMKRFNNNTLLAAKALGISRGGVYKKIYRYNLTDCFSNYREEAAEKYNTKVKA